MFRLRHLDYLIMGAFGLSDRMLAVAEQEYEEKQKQLPLLRAEARKDGATKRDHKRLKSLEEEISDLECFLLLVELQSQTPKLSEFYKNALEQPFKYLLKRSAVLVWIAANISLVIVVCHFAHIPPLVCWIIIPCVLFFLARTWLSERFRLLYNASRHFSEMSEDVSKAMSERKKRKQTK